MQQADQIEGYSISVSQPKLFNRICMVNLSQMDALTIAETVSKVAFVMNNSSN